MALSAEEILPPSPDVTPGISYADIVGKKRLTTTKQSILAAADTFNSNTSNNTSTEGIKALKTCVWKHARSPGAYLLDISQIPKLTDQQHLFAIESKYGARNFYGIKFLGRSNQRYIEIYPHPQIVKQFLEEGIPYAHHHIRLLPCKAVDGVGKVIQINLSDIPFLPDKEIKQGISEALSHFGAILDIGLKYEATQGWFMGTGYAVIQQDESKQYPELHHAIPWGDQGEVVYATFPDMPTWCRYCHEENHTKYECKKAQASMLCYGCHKYSHVVAECPEAKSDKYKLKKPFKKPRKSYLDSQEESTPKSPSKELLKSAYAPGRSKDIEQPAVLTETPAPQQSKGEESAKHDDYKSDDPEDEDYTPPSEDEKSTSEYDAMEDQEQAEDELPSNEMDSEMFNGESFVTSDGYQKFLWQQQQQGDRGHLINLDDIAKSPSITPRRVVAYVGSSSQQGTSIHTSSNSQ